MKKIIITNASSSLGINLANKLLEDENVFIYGYDYKLSKNIPSLFSLLRSDRYTFSEHNFLEPIEDVCEEIYHLLPVLNKEIYLKNKHEYIIREINILSNILESSKAVGARLAYVNMFCDFKGSNAEYFPYFNATILMHNLIEEYSKTEKIDYKICQISDYYGVNSLPSQLNNFVGDTIIKAFNNDEIKIDYNEYMYLTNVTDIVNGLIKIMNNYSDLNNYDITNPNICLKSEVISLILNFTKSRSNVVIMNKQPEETKYTANISPLNNNLNFRCTKPLLKGISETIDFYKFMYFS